MTELPPAFRVLWDQAAIVVVLLAILWAGHKGWWYWSPGVRALTAELARERDDWRTLAVTLLRKQGVELPDGYERSAPLALPGGPDERAAGPRSVPR